MPPHTLLLALLTAPAFGGCAAETGETGAPVGQEDEGIVGGKPANDYTEAALVDADDMICSGAIVAPRVVLTAGHCLLGGTYSVKAPYAGNQSARGRRSWTSYVPTGEAVNPSTLDVAVIVLDRAIRLAAYPKLSRTSVANGTLAVNVGRLKNGTASYSRLFYGREVAMNDGAPLGFPLAYTSPAVIQPGDSGGPVYVGAGPSRTIIAVNSGAGSSTQVLARVDLAYDKIQEVIAQNGGTTP